MMMFGLYTFIMPAIIASRSAAFVGRNAPNAMCKHTTIAKKNHSFQSSMTLNLMIARISSVPITTAIVMYSMLYCGCTSGLSTGIPAMLGRFFQTSMPCSLVACWSTYVLMTANPIAWLARNSVTRNIVIVVVCFISTN